jgi:WD40 repeat protein
MKHSLSLLGLIVLTLLISCGKKAIDPAIRVRPVYLQVSVSGADYKLSWQEARIVCVTTPCPDIADVEAQEYEVQIANSEVGTFHTYKTLDSDKKSINIPVTQGGEQLVARIVSKNKGALPVNSNSVMVTNAFLSQSAYYPGFGVSGDVMGGDVTSDEKKATYSLLIDEGAGHYVTPLYVADMEYERPVSTKLVTRQGGPATFSLDGKQLAYPSGADNGLVIYDIASGSTRVLPMADAASIQGVDWSPDGKWLAFSTFSNEESRLWKIAAAGGQAVSLAPPMLIRESNYIRQSDIDWSPDGQFIAVSRARSDNSGKQWRAVVSLYSPDGSGEVKYFETQPGWIDTNPSFSPDGNRLAFLSSRTDPLTDSYSLWVRDLPTGKVRQIKLLIGLTPSRDYAPRWLGNDRLLFMGFQQGRKGYFTVFL